jgi:hypothetical protein
MSHEERKHYFVDANGHTIRGASHAQEFEEAMRIHTPYTPLYKEYERRGKILSISAAVICIGLVAFFILSKHLMGH